MIYIFCLILIVFLGALSWIDLRTFRLPDILTLPLIGVGILQASLSKTGLIPSLIGAAVGYSAFVLVEITFKALHGKNGLGRGDAKLLAAGGAWCGWAGLPFIVLIGSGMGLVALLFPSMRRKADTGAIPFGPFLAAGIMLVWLSANLGLLTGG